MENLDLNSELLKPIKEKLEKSINTLTKNAILTDKEAEVTLKITIGTIEKTDKNRKRYLEPSFEYQLTEKIKEAKGSYKGHLGVNYQVEIDEKDNLAKVAEINKQIKIF